MNRRIWPYSPGIRGQELCLLGTKPNIYSPHKGAVSVAELLHCHLEGRSAG